MIIEYDGITLRDIAQSDVPVVASIYLAGWPKQQVFNQAQMESTITAWVRSSETHAHDYVEGILPITPETGFMHCFVAEHGGGVVGVIKWKCKNRTALVESLIVELGKRQLGHFTKMFEAGTAFVFSQLDLDAVEFDIAPESVPLNNKANEKGYDNLRVMTTGKRRVTTTKEQYLLTIT